MSDFWSGVAIGVLGVFVMGSILAYSDETPEQEAARIERGMQFMADYANAKNGGCDND